jgi:hypothetical protein
LVYAIVRTLQISALYWVEQQKGLCKKQKRLKNIFKEGPMTNLITSPAVIIAIAKAAGGAVCLGTKLCSLVAAGPPAWIIAGGIAVTAIAVGTSIRTDKKTAPKSS